MVNYFGWSRKEENRAKDMWTSLFDKTVEGSKLFDRNNTLGYVREQLVEMLDTYGYDTLLNEKVEYEMRNGHKIEFYGDSDTLNQIQELKGQEIVNYGLVMNTDVSDDIRTLEGVRVGDLRDYICNHASTIKVDCLDSICNRSDQTHQWYSSVAKVGSHTYDMQIPMDNNTLGDISYLEKSRTKHYQIRENEAFKPKRKEKKGLFGWGKKKKQEPIVKEPSLLKRKWNSFFGSQAA